jgi:hypothetical protein
MAPPERLHGSAYRYVSLDAEGTGDALDAEEPLNE